MRTRILDLDGGFVRQRRLLDQSGAEVLSLQDRGPAIRLACSHRSFRRFEDRLTQLLGCHSDTQPYVSFIGSGDFHHVSLALLRRLRQPCNLLILDNHPDWMRGVPFLHCGTWLYHAARLPIVERIFHVGGEIDFDNAYRWLAPWSLLESGKIIVAPSRRRFRGRRWSHIKHHPLRRSGEETAERASLADWLAPFRAELAARPLYVSLDKDVMRAEDAVVNWDSGHLTTSEVLAVLEAFVRAADGKLGGMDVVGDWSPVRVEGLLRRLFHWTEHPGLSVDAEGATRCNEAWNLQLLNHLAGWIDMAGGRRQPAVATPLTAG